MIANGIWLLIFWLTVVTAGHVVISMLLGRERRPWSEGVALVTAIGCGVVAMLLFWISLAGFKPSRPVLLVVLGIFGAAQIYLLRRGQRPFTIQKIDGDEPLSPLAWRCGVALIIVTAGCVLLVSLNALGLPVYEWDSFSIWALKAKVVALVPLTPQPGYFQDRALSFSHLDYPLLLPFLWAGIYGGIGGMNDQLGKTIFPILYVAFGFQLFTALRWKLDRTKSLVLTALGMSVPALVRWSGAGVADGVLMLYYIGAVFYLLKWRDEGLRADLLLSILFAAFAAFTKNEGLALVLLLAGLALLFAIIERSQIKVAGAGILVAGILILNLPWLWWSRSIPRIHENYLGRFGFSTIIENSNRLGPILIEFLRQTWTWSRWGGLWFLLLLAVIFGRRAFANRHVMILWLLLLGQLSLYVLAFVVTPWDVRELLDVALDRLFLQTVPVVILLIGCHWREANAPNALTPERVSS